MPPRRATGEDENPPDIATLLAQQLRDVKKTKGLLAYSMVITSMAGGSSREGYAGSQPWCANCRTHHHEKANCRLALGWRRNDHGGGNQVRGRAYNANMNAAEVAKDSSVVTSTFSLNDHFATVLFDSGADFSFISTKFAPILNMKPSIANPGYVIEIADGKKVKVDRIIRGCKLELGSSLFTIDLIPLGHGSFDVIVGMDWLSHNKAVIVCHEKVVEIPLVDGEILRVHGERVEESTKALKNAKVDEPKISDISVVREFVEVFPDDLKGLPPQRQVEFRIELIPGATPVAKSPYRLAPLEMQKVSEQLKELQDKGIEQRLTLKKLLPSSRIDNLLINLQGASYFSKIRSSIWINQKYEWGEEQEAAFQTLKNNLCDAPVLSLPDRVEDFIVYCDASNQGLGCLLMQRDKANMVADALSRKERVKPRRVHAMAMTIQSGMKRLNGLEQQMEKRDDGSLYFLDRIWVPLVGDVRITIMDEAHKSKYSVHPGVDKMYYDLRVMYWWPGMKRDIATYITNKVVLIKEKLKAARDRQKSYADNRRKPLEFEVGDRVMLKVSPWKGVICFGKKGKLASRYVGPFEILERIGHVSYRLRLPEELSRVHDTFHVSNLNKCLADASLHVPLGTR
ncbi:putative reverse transcriptase domain-containing protein [Tanacetum coccineum]